MPSYVIILTSRESAARQSLYLIGGAGLTAQEAHAIAEGVVVDAVTQHVLVIAGDQLNADATLPSAGMVLEVAYRPGVTDAEGESLRLGAERIGIATVETARSVARMLLPDDEDPTAAARRYANDLVQMTLVYAADGTSAAAARAAFYRHLLGTPDETVKQVTDVVLTALNDEQLLDLSRRGVLALDLDEMRAIQSYYRSEGREPRDGELETLAQTWSEHCSHKTFKAAVEYRRIGAAQPVDAAVYPALAELEQGTVTLRSLIRSYLMRATETVAERRNDGWIRSAFVDNAGILAFGDAHEVSIKVETHNHPSALEPFGGANTGVGGVLRDVLGVSARPIAALDVLCFGPPHLPADAVPPGVLTPQRTAGGVIAGIRDYGNKLGVPTVAGAVVFDEGYLANPLVYAGTVGFAPRGLHPRNVTPGDAVVVMGGRTGRDGIHGATFSSIELTDTTAADVGSAVQIGDPISEKKVLDVILAARDRGLYSAITDCGAGGLSSAVGEMGAETGATVDLATVPTKYAGLQPWEIWISEAQERMVLAVPPQHLEALLQLCADEDVEATAIGRFTDNGRLLVTYRDLTVVDLAMDFLHDGRPNRTMQAVWQPSSAVPQPTPAVAVDSALRGLLAHPNIASREPIIRTYDHEVGGATVIKPLVGAAMHGPSDATVLQPLAHDERALALGVGINARYGRIDPYWMGLAVIDEALRNVVAVGGDPARTALLDNFCWGDPRQPDRMAGLVRASAACYDAALALGTPFVSGKDSLNNEYRDQSGRRVAIPPTLLITALAEVPQSSACVTMDLKQAGDLLFLVGTTREELAGSPLSDLGCDLSGATLPQVDLAAAARIFPAVHRAIRSGAVSACHDVSEGGVAVAAAEMAIAGRIGLQLDLSGIGDHLSVTARCFAETPSRFLISVAAEQREQFLTTLGDVPVLAVGSVSAEPYLTLTAAAGEVYRWPVEELEQIWRNGLADLPLEVVQ
jgi:phosphoribosylformylglycinamidine synthase II